MTARSTIRALTILLLIILRASSALAGGNQPYLVKDINPSGNSSLTALTTVGDRVFFNAMHVSYGQELWVSDGIEAGTYMVVDLIPGPDGSVPQWMFELNGKVVYQADNNQNGMDWYISDGTAAGSLRLLEFSIQPRWVANLLSWIRRSSRVGIVEDGWDAGRDWTIEGHSARGCGFVAL